MAAYTDTSPPIRGSFGVAPALAFVFMGCAMFGLSGDRPLQKPSGDYFGALVTSPEGGSPYTPPTEGFVLDFYHDETDGFTDQGLEIPPELVPTPHGTYDLPPIHGRFAFADAVADFYHDDPPQNLGDFVLELCALPPLTDPRVFAEYFDALHDYFVDVPGAYRLAVFAARQAMLADPHDSPRMIRSIAYELDGAYDGYIDFARINIDLRAIQAADQRLESQIRSAQLLQTLHSVSDGAYGEARIRFRLAEGPQIGSWPSVLPN